MVFTATYFFREISDTKIKDTTCRSQNCLSENNSLTSPNLLQVIISAMSNFYKYINNIIVNNNKTLNSNLVKKFFSKIYKRGFKEDNFQSKKIGNLITNNGGILNLALEELHKFLVFVSAAEKKRWELEGTNLIVLALTLNFSFPCIYHFLKRKVNYS